MLVLLFTVCNKFLSLTESSDEESSSGDVRGRESSGRRYGRHDREWRHERDMPRDRDHWDRRHSDYRRDGGRGGTTTDATAKTPKNVVEIIIIIIGNKSPWSIIRSYMSLFHDSRFNSSDHFLQSAILSKFFNNMAAPFFRIHDLLFSLNMESIQWHFLIYFHTLVRRSASHSIIRIIYDPTCISIHFRASFVFM